MKPIQFSPTVNALKFGYIAPTKQYFFITLRPFWEKTGKTQVPTFEIYGLGAAMWCHYNN